MAVGDAKVDNQSIAAAAHLDIQPAASEEWILQNIFAEADVELYWYDGTDNLKFDECSAGGRWWSNLSIRMTNTFRVRVKNVNAAAKLIGYAAVQSK